MARVAPARAAAALLVGAASMVVWVAACGLSRNGLMDDPRDDGGATGSRDAGLAHGDGAGDEGSAEAGPTCATLDAACLGVVPAGWQPVDVGDGGCGPGYTARTLLTNPRLLDGGCGCGACQAIGSYGCDASVAVSGGDSCNDPTLVTVTPGACAAAQAQHVEAHVAAATGSVGCFAPSDAGTGVTTDTLTLCIPGCATDYCQATRHCIATEGDLACPAGFTLLASAGAGADPGCAPCPCEAAPPGTCGGSVIVYGNTTCDDSGVLATYTAGTCNEYSSDYASVLVELVAPPATCTSPTADDGDASLTGVVTVCCQ